MTAEEFLALNKAKPKASKIEPFFEEVLKLRKAGMSYNQILEFLRMNGVIVTYSTLADYLRRHAPAELLPPPKNQPVKTTNQPTETTVKKTAPVAPRTASTSAPTVFDKKRKPEVNLDFLDED